MLKTKALWCGASDAGVSPTEVHEFVEKTFDAGFNLLLPEFKHGDGSLSFQSDLHPECVRAELAGFDLAAELLAETRKSGQELHAWFIDYMETPNSPANTQNPSWACLDPSGRPTDAEMLRGKRYGARWMCPARSPGYTDEWLVPLYAEFAKKYAFDGLHHDYVRYPGDLAPDQYCFCDWCLNEIPRWAGYATKDFPHERLSHPVYDREYVESHWEPSPTVLPEDWDRLDRRTKAEFLRDGRFFAAGRADLDYFFYTFRAEAIERFVRLCAEAVRETRPGMRLSGAFFKNPVHSGRFLGQDWRKYAPWVDDCFPMDYRDHYPGSFETYLVLLGETIQDQSHWSRPFSRYAPGIAINFLYYEEELPLLALAQAAERGDRESAAGFWPSVESALTACNKTLGAEIAAWVAQGDHPPLTMEDARRYLSHRRLDWFTDVSGVAPGFSDRLSSFAERPPTAYWPKNKLGRVAEAALASGATGLVVFCYNHLDKYGLWEEARHIFKS